MDCCKNLASFDVADPQGFRGDVQELDESCYADLRFLRLAKTLRSVWMAAPADKTQSEDHKSVDMTDTCSPVVGDSKSMNTPASTESALSSVVGEDSLWSLLSSCLADIESQHTALSKASSSTSSTSPALSRLQPLVEAYFVVHAPLSLQSSNLPVSGSEAPGAARNRSGQASEGTISTSAANSEPAGGVSRSRSGLACDVATSRVEAWIEFAEKHRNALNAYLRQVYFHF